MPGWIRTHIWIYIYIYICVCVFVHVGVCAGGYIDIYYRIITSYFAQAKSLSVLKFGS